MTDVSHNTLTTHYVIRRWVEDYIQPAIENNKIENFKVTLEKTRVQIEKKLAQQDNRSTDTHKSFDPDETETESEDSENESRPPKRAEGAKTKGKHGKKKTARKAKSTKVKTKSNVKSSEEDLIAAIRNKNGRGNPLASIASRYGVSSIEGDPLDDAKFEELRSKYPRK